MPSKPVGVFMILFVVAAVWATSQVDWTRDVPYAPTNVPLHAGRLHTPVADVGPAPGVPQPGPSVGPADEPETGPDEPAPEPMPKPEPTKPTPPPPPPPPDSGLGLPQVPTKQPRPIPDVFVAKIIIEKDGRLLAGGVPIGKSHELLADRVKFEKTDTIVLLPQEETPWKYVYWAIQAGMKGGATKVGFGLRVGRRDAMILLPLPAGEVKLDPEIPELPIVLGADSDGDYTYTVSDYKASDVEDMAKWAGSTNGEYAAEFGGEYAKDPLTTPWVFICEPEIPYGEALTVISLIRDQAIYSMRFGGDFPEPPK